MTERSKAKNVTISQLMRALVWSRAVNRVLHSAHGIRMLYRERINIITFSFCENIHTDIMSLTTQ